MNIRSFLKLLTSKQRQQFADLSGTKRSYLWAINGGHSRASLRLMWRMGEASRKMFPSNSARWLTLDEMHIEAEEIRARRQPILKRAAKRRAKRATA